MQNSQFGLVLTIILIIALVWVLVNCSQSRMMPINEDYSRKYKHLDLAYKYPIFYNEQLYKSQKGTARPYLGYLYDFNSVDDDDDSSYQQQQDMHYDDYTDEMYEDQAYKALDFSDMDLRFGHSISPLYGVDKKGNIISRTPTYYDPNRHSEGAPRAVMGYDPLY